MRFKAVSRTVTCNPQKSCSRRQSRRDPTSTTLAVLLNCLERHTERKVRASHTDFWEWTFSLLLQDSATLDLRGIGQVLPTHLMEERLIRQQQEMEEDQRWLEKEERFLVTESQKVLAPLSLWSWLYCRWWQTSSVPKQEPLFSICFLKLAVVGRSLFLNYIFRINF